MTLGFLHDKRSERCVVHGVEETVSVLSLHGMMRRCGLSFQFNQRPCQSLASFVPIELVHAMVFRPYFQEIGLHIRSFCYVLSGLPFEGARYTTSDPSAVPDLSDRNFGALSAAVCLHRACTICDIHITRHGFCRCSRQCRDLVGLSRWRNLLKHERPRDASHRLVKAITTPRLSTATVP